MREGRVSSEKTARAEVDHVKKYNAKFNAFITVFEGESEPALDAARRADKRVARDGGPFGALFGVPLAIKDNFFFSGYRTTDACVAFQRFRPKTNARLVDSLIDMGAIPLGKTNMHELALGATSSSSFFGPVRNPFDSGRVSGGSSGGTAVAVALSMGPVLGLGSDTGGSVRVPAALCGVCGFKPSIGKLSTEGVFPLAATLDHSGLMTRTMPDMTAAFQALTGDRDAKSHVRGGRPRIGIPVAHFDKDMDKTVSGAFWSAVDRLRYLDEFRILEDTGFPNAVKTTKTRTTIQFREAAWFYDEIVRTERLRRGMHADVLGFLDRGARIGMLGYMGANLERAEFIGRMNRIFSEIDFMMMPTCLILAPKLDEVMGEEGARMRPLLLKDTEPFNLCGFPALSIPASPSAGRLPVGIQISGRFGQDMEVLAVGEALCRVLR